ncbi:unnamed protein product [Paramecium primaurelia]|uniref:Uncharacterized protein n=1 Tax=Paramecium primaurelia TaxID=5886 RepID=A0A8S1L8B2_PARPR|nr:unnamed protein product [Paramecium primaurelia]
MYELKNYGHKYMYRLIPDYKMKAYLYDKYKSKQSQDIYANVNKLSYHAQDNEQSQS